MRKIYLDNLRLSTVLLVVLYHAAYLFNGVGMSVGITAGHSIAVFDILAASVYPWFMVLLFIISGMASRFSLESRSTGEFIKDRTVRLLVPSTIGVFAFHMWTGYFNMLNAGADLSSIPSAVRPFIIAVSGTGVLWYMQVLWLYSVLLILICRIRVLERLGEKSGYIALVLYSLLIYLGAQILNTPVIVVYRFGIYGVAFFIGYFAFSDDTVIEKADNARFIFLGISAMAYAVYLYRFIGSDYTDSSCLKSLITNLYGYFMSVSLLGFFHHYADKSCGFIEYLKKREIGIYVFHYTVMVTAAYCIIGLGLPYFLNYLIVILSGYAGSIVLFEIVSRIPIYRWAVLGIKGTCTFHKSNN